MTSQRAREAAEDWRDNFGRKGSFADLKLAFARLEAEAIERGARAMLAAAAIHARCAFDDRPRREGIDYQDGWDDGTKGAANAVLAIDPATVVKGLTDAQNQ